jgi:hypothetical protein
MALMVTTHSTIEGNRKHLREFKYIYNFRFLKGRLGKFHRNTITEARKREEGKVVDRDNVHSGHRHLRYMFVYVG